MGDEREIRELIERWVAAVHAGDMATVLADHADDIVMFDVTPPEGGVRGIDAYRDVWPPFFEWQRSGAVFELTELEIVAGADVAFAYALLRCGTPEELAAEPDRRLRLTLGLVRADGRWVVRHEHHSGTFAGPPDTAGDEREIRAIHDRWSASTAARDLDGMMGAIAPDVVSYEHDPPLQYDGVDAVREACRAGLESAAGAVGLETPDLAVAVDGDLAVAWGINHMTAEDAGGEVTRMWSRGTRVFRRRGDGWLMVHQHVSFPVDPETGQAVMDQRP